MSRQAGTSGLDRERAEEQRRAYERRQRAERAEEAGEQKGPEEG